MLIAPCMLPALYVLRPFFMRSSNPGAHDAHSMTPHFLASTFATHLAVAKAGRREEREGSTERDETQTFSSGSTPVVGVRLTCGELGEGGVQSICYRLAKLRKGETRERERCFFYTCS